MSLVPDAPAVAAAGSILLGSETLAAVVEPAGGRIASLVHTPTATEFLLRTPWAGERWEGTYPAHNSSAEWHRRYAGGWHTLIPHAGDEREVDRVGHPFHGEAAWRQWRVCDSDDSSVRLEVILRTVPLRVERTVRLTADALIVTQTLVNLSGRPVNVTWTEHPAFGPAVSGPDARIRVGDGAFDRELTGTGQHFSTFRSVPAGPGVAEVVNAGSGAFARLRWDADLLPHLHVWQEHESEGGFPWWGTVSALALEPASRVYDAEDAALGPIVVPGSESLTSSFRLEVGVRGWATRHLPARQFVASLKS